MQLHSWPQGQLLSIIDSGPDQEASRKRFGLAHLLTTWQGTVDVRAWIELAAMHSRPMEGDMASACEPPIPALPPPPPPHPQFPTPTIPTPFSYHTDPSGGTAGARAAAAGLQVRHPKL